MSGERRLVPGLRGRGFCLGAIVVAVALGLGLAPPMAGAEAPAASAGSDPEVIEGSYIVTLEPGHNPKKEAARLSEQHGGRARHVYEHALRGFSFEASEQAAASLARNPKVRSVVADRRVAVAAQVTPTGIERIDGPLSGTISGNGSGSVDVDVAVIDTGIDVDHPDLNVVGGRNCSKGSSFDDGNGHGTHVAGTVGAKDDGAGVVGVAPGARLWAVRVLDNRGSGSWSSVICGVDYVTGNASTIEVANMSLGGSGSEGSCTDGGLHEAICRSVKAGVTYVVAAGNSARDAKGDVPASYDEVITVSALADFDGKPGGGGAATCRMDVDDTLADFSNFGADIDLIAPGVCIHSTWTGGGYNTISGTSMASPHVAGAAALYKSDHPGASPAAVQSALGDLGNLDWNHADDPDGTKETLLKVGALVGTTIIDDGGLANSAPLAAFTWSCTDLTCSFTDTSTDGDGIITTRDWTFGDGSASTSANPEPTYGAAGTYTVTLTVTDDDGATNTKSNTVTVSAPSAGGFTLGASGYKVKGLQKADLTWSGATTTAVDIYRNGVSIASDSDGAYTDEINHKGGGSYTYKVCEAGSTAVCSAEVTISF